MTKHVLAAFSALAILSPALLHAEDAPIEVQVVDSMNKVFGGQNGFRATHAKGLVFEGTFRGSPEGASLSKAILFAGEAIRVTVRFSDNGGIPSVPDGSAGAVPHGMAVKFHLPDGSESDMVTNSLKFFPVATAEELRDLLNAVAESPPDAPKPTKVEQFIANHPTVLAANASATTPASFAEQQYQGINAFVLVNKAGERQAVRFRIVPERLVLLEPGDAAKRAPDFLMRELPERLARGPANFRLQAQLASPGDQTKDPSRPWPENRRTVDLGVLTIERVVPDSAAAEKALLYLPGQLADGIELSDDPMVQVRSGAYATSFSRRNP